jgi:type VI secretion system protein ImpE
MTPEDLLKTGDPYAALDALKAEIRAKPSDARLRVFLFQLFSVICDWPRAVQQLKTAATLDPAAETMAHMYREAIVAEVYRSRVFAGEADPCFRGDPPGWLANLSRALKMEIAGNSDAEGVRAAALAQAPAARGTQNGTPFDWIADADMRFGPVLEVILNGVYVWLPFSDIAQITIDAPSDLRDLVWTPATLTMADGADMIGLIPTRYPGAPPDGAHALARATGWSDTGIGSGQRMFATDTVDLPLLEARTITFTSPAPDENDG